MPTEATIACPDCGKLVSIRFPMHTCTIGIKVGQRWKFTCGMVYRITKVNKTHVWYKWTAFGDSRRDLSHRSTIADFESKKHYLLPQ